MNKAKFCVTGQSILFRLQNVSVTWLGIFYFK